MKLCCASVPLKPGSTHPSPASSTGAQCCPGTKRRRMSISSCGKGSRKCRRQIRQAFTLMEMLVVMVIIGILAALGLPALRGLSQANSIAAAHRQLLDDAGIARLRAINGRTTVYMVFLSSNIVNVSLGSLAPADRSRVTNLLGGQFT